MTQDVFGDQAHIAIRDAGVSAHLCLAGPGRPIRTLGINGMRYSATGALRARWWFAGGVLDPAFA